MSKTPTRSSSVSSDKPRVPDTPDSPAPPVVPGAERLTIPIKDGKIFWEGIRATRRDELRSMLMRSGIDARPAPSAVTLPPATVAAIAGSLYDVLAQVESLVAVRVFGCTVDQAFAALAFTDAEKAALADPTGRVLAKYLPASLLDRYADECMLLLLLITMTRGKVATLQDTLIKAARAQAGPARVVPITQDADNATVEP